MALLDRPWLLTWTACFAGPVDVPDVEELRAFMLSFIEEHPRHIIAMRCNREALRWEVVPQGERRAHAERVISYAPDPDLGSEAQFVNAHAPGLEDPHPFKIVVGAESVAHYVCHGVGDAPAIGTVTGAVLRRDAALLASLEPRIRTADVFGWMLRQCVREPRATLDAVRNRHRQVDPGIINRTDAHPPTPLRPGGPTIVATSLSADVVRDVRSWRDTEMPGVSVASIFATAAFLALDRAGIAMNPSSFHAVVDTRRHVPEAHRRKAGNLAKGLDVVADMRNPRSVAAAMGEAVTSRRPILSMLASVVNTARGRFERRPEPEDAPVTGPMTLGFSWLPDGSTTDVLPWIPGRDRRFVAGARSTGRHGIGVFAIPIGATLEVSASFHSAGADPLRVHNALEALGSIRSVLNGAFAPAP